MNNKDPKIVERMTLPDIARSHNYPFSAIGDAQLRAIRNHYLEVFAKKCPGKELDIPFPTAIHLMMNEFCKQKGIELLEEDQHLLK